MDCFTISISRINRSNTGTDDNDDDNKVKCTELGPHRVKYMMRVTCSTRWV